MKARNNSLDGLRAIAALAVLSFHVWLYNLSGHLENPGLADTIAFESRVALIFFFVLSGYLIYRPFARAALTGKQPASAFAFLRRRAARIVPAYYVAIAAAFVLMATVPEVAGKREIGAEWLPAFFLFLQNYFPATVMNLDGPTWTLGVEVGFYLMVPVLAALALRGRRGLPAQFAMLGGLVVAGLGWNLLAHLQDWSTIAAHAPFPFLPYFALGMLVAVAGEAKLWRPDRGASIALTLGGLALIVANAWWHQNTNTLGPAVEIFRDLPAAIGMTAILAAATIGSATGMGWLSSRPLVWIGEVSFGLYLWHVPVIVWLNGNGLLPDGFFIRMAIILPLTLSIGAASWYLIERPFIRRERRLPRSRAEHDRPAQTGGQRAIATSSLQARRAGKGRRATAAAS